MQRTNVVTIAVLLSVVHQVSDGPVNFTPECCPDGKTGNACNITCPHCIYRDINGTCHKLCSGGLWGKECHLNCSQRCVKGLDGQPLCDKGTGHCSNGCIQGYYGYTCEKNCSENCDKNICYQMNGTCVKFKTGHHGERYDKPNDAAPQKRITDPKYDGHSTPGPHCCPDKTTGNKCQIKCPYCINRRINGTCYESCTGGYWGGECRKECFEECVKGNDGTPLCNKSTGECSNGCIQGYYGSTCQEHCSKNCAGKRCYVNGTCVKCKPRNYGERCDKECGYCERRKCNRNGTCVNCIPGYYGERCDKRCGHCERRECNRNGTCTCESGWCGELCKSRCPQDSSNPTDRDHNEVYLLYALVCIGLILLVVAIFNACWISFFGCVLCKWTVVKLELRRLIRKAGNCLKAPSTSSHERGRLPETDTHELVIDLNTARMEEKLLASGSVKADNLTNSFSSQHDSNNRESDELAINPPEFSARCKQSSS